MTGLAAHILPFFHTLLSLFATGEQATIVFAGDAMQHKAQIDAARRADGSYDYTGCFDAVRPYIESADYAVVNFEASLGGKPYSGYPCFSAPDEYSVALADAGFDFFLLANNHILDRRDRGMHRTVNMLDSIGMPYAGVYHDSVARDTLVPAIVDVGGFKVALLNYTYGTNGITLSGTGIVDYIDRRLMAEDVACARQTGADIVAACVHWGDEYKLLPSPSQKSLADYLVSLGVDMIIGGHPHVVQPMEMRSGPDGKPVLVVYSLGNFISNMKTADTRGGVMVRVRLSRDETGRAEVSGASYLPVFTEPPSGDRRNFRICYAPESSDPRAAVFMRRAEDLFKRYNINVARDTIYSSSYPSIPN